MRVGDSTRTANRQRRPIDLVEQLKEVLGSLGITILDPPEDGDGGDTVATSVHYDSPRRPVRRQERRSSFDDARFEETWLSEHTESVNPSVPVHIPQDLLSVPHQRRGGTAEGRRARSVSAQRGSGRGNDAFRYPNQFSRPRDPDPAPRVSSAYHELEARANDFLRTTSLRSARQAFYAWHSHALRLEQHKEQALALAQNHDRRALLVQALDLWRDALDVRQHIRQVEEQWKRREYRAVLARDNMLLRKTFMHWATSTADEKLRVAVAHRHILRFTYFNRWRAIAVENQTKARKILCRKYLAIWREKTARRLLWEEQAEAHYEETLMRRSKRRWFWAFCSRRVEGWHDQWVERHAFTALRSAVQQHRRQHLQAEEYYYRRLLHRCIKTLVDKRRSRQADYTAAQDHNDRALVRRVFDTVHVHAGLAPIERTVHQNVDRSVTRKAIRIWKLNLDLSEQASGVDRRRLLQTAWTNWNNALRCKALAQKIDERLIVETLYRWVLQERLRHFQRTINSRILGRVVAWWRAKIEDERDRLADAAVVFAERQRRRRLASSMLRLNSAMRAREDAERAAVELAMYRALPKAIEPWKDKTDHIQRLQRWAVDARFYCLCTNTLRVWKARTDEQVANRRREAYLQVRVRVKTRLVRQCFSRMQSAYQNIRAMWTEAERTQQSRLAVIGTDAFDKWRESTHHYHDLEHQAAAMYSQKLQRSVIDVLRLQHLEIERMHEQAQAFKQDTDLALLAGGLRRVQWATFTATRKAESGEALWARNRDQHVRQMLKHWASQTAERRTTVAQARDAVRTGEEEPESPSLRPASRVASRSREGAYAFTSSPPPRDLPQSTPGYMRTPSRPRRAGRFRPLPTPAAVTPMAFDSTYLANTPGPLPQGRRASPGVRGLDDPRVDMSNQVTPFSQKLRAGGIQASRLGGQSSVLRRGELGRSTQGGTNKSVRFAGSSRFRSPDDQHVKNS
jgi:protein SFI1